MSETTPPPPIQSNLYRQRWIAIVKDRVVGVGNSRHQAYRAAKQVRPKDEPQLYFVASDGTLNHTAPPEAWFANHPLLQQVTDLLQKSGQEAYLVGGAVRDFLLDRETVVDLDFAVTGSGIAVARRIANALHGAFYPLDLERDTGRAIYRTDQGPKFFLDFASFRGRTLTEDLLDRDFTINAMALGLTRSPHLIDPAGGQSDLETGLIRAVSPSALRRDPVRVIRAVRQAINFGFEIEANTRLLVTEAAALLPLISPERQRDELMKLLHTPWPGRAVQMLQQLGVLLYLIPEAAAMAGVPQSEPHYLDVLEHTTAAMDAWSRLVQNHWSEVLYPHHQKIEAYLGQTLAGELSLQELMPLALLLHDTGKPLTRTRVGTQSQTRIQFLKHEHRSAGLARKISRRLHFSTQVTDFLETVVRHHLRPLWLAESPQLSRKAIFRFFRDTKTPQVQAGVATALHALADRYGTYPPGQGQTEIQALQIVTDQLLTAYFEQEDQVVVPPPLLTGRDLMSEFGLQEGKLIGMLLQELQEAQAAGQVLSRADAVSFIKDHPSFSRFETDNL